MAVGLWQHPLERPLFAVIAPIAWLITLLFWKPVTNCETFSVFDLPCALLSELVDFIV